MGSVCQYIVQRAGSGTIPQPYLENINTEDKIKYISVFREENSPIQRIVGLFFRIKHFGRCLVYFISSST
jgi:hypothetical protein